MIPWVTFFAPQTCPAFPGLVTQTQEATKSGCTKQTSFYLGKGPAYGEDFVLELPPGPALILLIVDTTATYASADIEFANLPAATTLVTADPVGAYGTQWDARRRDLILPAISGEPNEIEVHQDFTGIDRNILFAAQYVDDNYRIHTATGEASRFCLTNLSNSEYICYVQGARIGPGSTVRLTIMICNADPEPPEPCGENMRVLSRVKNRGPAETWMVFAQSFDYRTAGAAHNVAVFE